VIPNTWLVERIARELRATLADLEWSGTIWTDTKCCLFCGRTVEGLPGTDKYPEEPPLTHADDCQWVRLMSGSRVLIDGV
jgi:hypothetical protein